MSIESLKVQIIKKAWEEPAFKQDLLADAKSAIKSAFGVDIDAGIELQAIEATPSRHYLIVPPSPENAGDGEASPNSVWN